MRKLWGSEPRKHMTATVRSWARAYCDHAGVPKSVGHWVPKAILSWSPFPSSPGMIRSGYEWHGFLLCDLRHVSQPFWVPGVSCVQWEQQQHPPWGSFWSSDKREKPEGALKRLTQGRAARSFLGQAIPLKTAPPAVREDIRALKRGGVHRRWAQPTPQENPRAFQPWEGHSAPCSFHGENSSPCHSATRLT